MTELSLCTLHYALNGVDTAAFIVLGLAILGLQKLFRDTIGRKRAGIGAAGAVGFGVAGGPTCLSTAPASVLLALPTSSGRCSGCCCYSYSV